MSFTIVEHPATGEGLAIIEVTYPAEPTAEEVASYTFRIMRVMDAQTRPWCCLVDQRAVKFIPPKLLDKIGLLNAYAVRRQMRASARLVASSVASLQTHKMAENAHLEVKVQTFTERDDALTWLRTQRG